MKILLSGSSGLVGSAMAQSFAGGFGAVTRLVRREPAAGGAEIRWDPQTQQLHPGGLEGFDAVVHLAGESIVRGRWTESKKSRIRDSRLLGTRLLCRTLARLSQPPKVLVSASAVGFYGDRGHEELDESSPPGSGFLAEVCREWEAATQPALEAGIRVVQLRFGVVLSAAGGALAKMLPLFRLGLGGRLGSGKQYMSWITLDDLVRAARHVLVTDSLQGPTNAVAPQPVTNLEFTKTLGRVLRRPTICPAPATLLRIALGQLADELLLASARVVPRRLLDSGFQFTDAQLAPALARLLAPA